MVGVFVVIITSLVVIFAWGKDGLPPRALVFGLSVGAAGGVCQHLALALLFPGLGGGPVLTVAVCGLAGVAGTIAALRCGLRPALALARLAPAGVWHALGEAIALGVALGLANVGMITLYRQIIPLPAWAVALQERASATTVFLLSVQAGLTEETVFRLLALPVFLWALRHLLAGRRERVSVAGALLLSAVIFVAVHGRLPPGYWVYATGAGVLLGLLFLRHGIEAPMVAHFLADLLSWGPVVMGWV
ncbi:MAG: CPBP family intramembrane metalloprotease [Bacillota bacterium]|nr:CPBP family intramembrane metalloprotease [Bacillota bacterium]MDI7250506.1 CPBP family intramembrane metalloprotease [Bacillota bacterium]